MGRTRNFGNARQALAKLRRCLQRGEAALADREARGRAGTSSAGVELRYTHKQCTNYTHT